MHHAATALPVMWCYSAPALFDFRCSLMMERQKLASCCWHYGKGTGQLVDRSPNGTSPHWICVSNTHLNRLRGGMSHRGHHSRVLADSWHSLSHMCHGMPKVLLGSTSVKMAKFYANGEQVSGALPNVTWFVRLILDTLSQSDLDTL
jgi:hypothetical protein